MLLAHAQLLSDVNFIRVWSPTKGVVERCTYAELADQMLGAAHWLRKAAHVRDGDWVALYAPNSVAYLTCSLAAMSLGAASVNQAVKAVAIARQFVEEEAIDLCCRPEFVELSDDQLGDGTAGGPTSALRLLVLVEQT